MAGSVSAVAGASTQGGFSSSAGAGGTNVGGRSDAGDAGVGGAAVGGAAGNSPSGGGATGSSAGSAGSSAAFTQVSAIFGKNCGIAGCHADKQSPRLAADSKLYATLTAGTVLAECDYTKLIEPGDPAKSALVRLMNRQCGSFTMPPSCSKTPCLPSADLKLLSDWIQAGALP